MRRAISTIIVCLTFCIFFFQSFGQKYYQTVVYFKSGVNRNVTSTDTSATVTDPSTQTVLTRYSIPSNQVFPSFPEFNASDTLVGSIKQMNKTKVFSISTSDSTTNAHLIADLKPLSNVLYAEDNSGDAVAYTIPNDPGFSQQWGLSNNTSGNSGKDVHATGAWSIFAGSTSSIIAIVDFGVDVTHPDLSGKFAGGDHTFNIANNGNGNQSHGTLMAGIAAASTNNATGMAGMDWNAKFISEDITDYWECFCINYFRKKHGNVLVAKKVYDAVRFSPNVNVINASFGQSNPKVYSTTTREAFAFAEKNNRVCVSAISDKGNLAGATYPVAYNSQIIGVQPTDNFDNQYSTQAVPAADVAAPGYNIYTTNYGNTYTSQVSGTSPATAFVSGEASLLKGFKPSLTNHDIEHIIELSADDIALAGYDTYSGYGRINAEKALKYLNAPYSVFKGTAIGGTIYSTGATSVMKFLGVPGFVDDLYLVQKVEVRKTITLPTNFCSVIGAWGDGATSKGAHDDQGALYGENFCEMVPGSLTSTSVTLRTYVYNVSKYPSGMSYGTYPMAAASAVFGYGVLGPSKPSIQGDNTFCGTSNNYTVANLYTAPGSTSAYTWTGSPSNLAAINTPTAAQTTLAKLGNGSYTLSASITNVCAAGQTANISKVITLSGGPTSATITSVMVGPASTGQVQVNFNVPVGTTATSYKFFVDNVVSKSGTGAPLGTNVVLNVPGCGTQHSVYLQLTDNCGSANSNTVSFTRSCSAAASAFSVAPNPASTIIHIQPMASSIDGMKSRPVQPSDAPGVSKSINRIELVNAAGAMVLVKASSAVESNVSIDVSNLANGVYFLRVVTSNFVESHKVIVAHN